VTLCDEIFRFGGYKKGYSDRIEPSKEAIGQATRKDGILTVLGLLNSLRAMEEWQWVKRIQNLKIGWMIF